MLYLCEYKQIIMRLYILIIFNRMVFNFYCLSSTCNDDAHTEAEINNNYSATVSYCFQELGSSCK